MRIKWFILPFVFGSQCNTRRLRTTVSGKTCQRWDASYPHKPKYFPNPRNHNFCRNPDNDPKGLWCYTTDPKKRYEYCSCSATPATTTRAITKPTKPTTQNCDCINLDGSYSGQTSRTKSGYTCQRWDKNYPQVPKYKPSPTNNNYCRLPDDDTIPWCYTTNPSKRWEHCAISKCGSNCRAPPTPPIVGTTQCGITNRDPIWDEHYALPDIVSSTGRTSPLTESDNPLIYGGDTALPQRLPWQILLRGPFGCGGTLVSMKTVITAMHCVVGTSARQWSITAGHIKKSSRDAQLETGYQNKRVKNLITHQKYSSSTNDNDIAIMVVESPFQYTNYVRPACLPKSNFKISNGANVIISGWGATENGSTNKLLKNIIPMHSMAKCKANLYNRVTEHMICGGKPGEDTCQGDSGGPLIAIVENDIGTKKYTLIGVTSWGYGCGEVNKPGVYAEVADYITWIKQYM